MFAISLSSFVLSLLLSFVLTRLVRNHAVKHGWVSLPESDRHIHTAALPRIGGVAIYAAAPYSGGDGGQSEHRKHHEDVKRVR